MIYRFVRMAIGGDAGHTLIVEHGCDQDAFAEAQIFAAGRAVEVWCDNRQLATLLPNRGLFGPVNRLA